MRPLPRTLLLVPLLLALLALPALFALGCGTDEQTSTETSPAARPPTEVVEESASPDASPSASAADDGDYPIVDTNQSVCFDNETEINCPEEGEAFYGQDAQFEGNAPSYADNGDGTVTDEVTGLMWQQSPDTDGDGTITPADKLTIDQAEAYVEQLNEEEFAGYDDWRLPTIKQLYSLIEFSGTDPDPEGTGTAGLVPFIDADVFGFAWGDTSAGERIIDVQYASSTRYVSTTMNGDETLFGVNFADGRIKGYGLTAPGGGEKTFAVQCVRGTSTYGTNAFVDNGDGMITDEATGLMWSQDDSAAGMDWEEALAWVEKMNTEDYLGHNDWRIPNVKELQSIVDYTRSPDTTGSAAIDPLFDCSEITDEAGQVDYPWYWSSTTHAQSNGSGAAAAYVSFGRSPGYMGSAWMDVHGAGSQRSDPKAGDAADYPTGRGPQGDAIRIDNHVRLVRDTD